MRGGHRSHNYVRGEALACMQGDRRRLRGIICLRVEGQRISHVELRLLLLGVSRGIGIKLPVRLPKLRSVLRVPWTSCKRDVVCPGAQVRKVIIALVVGARVAHRDCPPNALHLVHSKQLRRGIANRLILFVNHLAANGRVGL